MSKGQRLMIEARQKYGDLYGRFCEDCGKKLKDYPFKIGKGPQPDSTVLHHLDTTLRGTDAYWNFSDLSKFALLCPSCHVKRHYAVNKSKGFGGWNWVHSANRDLILKKIQKTNAIKNFYSWCHREAIDALKHTKEWKQRARNNVAKGHLGISTSKKGKTYPNLWVWEVIENKQKIRKGDSYNGMSFYLLKKNNLIRRLYET